jgi:hypothetical protein
MWLGYYPPRWIVDLAHSFRETWEYLSEHIERALNEARDVYRKGRRAIFDRYWKWWMALAILASFAIGFTSGLVTVMLID